MGQADYVVIITFLECLLNNALFFCYTNQQDKTGSGHMNMDFTSCWHSKTSLKLGSERCFRPAKINMILHVALDFHTISTHSFNWMSGFTSKPWDFWVKKEE